MSYIVAIETAVPQYCHQQKDIATFFMQLTKNETIQRKIKFVSDKSGITTRYSVINDFSNEGKRTLFHPQTMPSINHRMAVYQSEALKLALQAIYKITNFQSLKNTITHIITVSCTGVYAPGLDIQLMKELEFSSSTTRHSINFMGCNAAILALKQAKSICDSTSNSTVLMVCVELCTIHFQHNETDDNILSNNLFGDGAAATIISSTMPNKVNYPLLKISSFHSLIIAKGHNDMAWQLSTTGFLMNLTSYISELINGNMKAFFENNAINKNEIDYWAIHPGGKKIIDDFANTMQLKPQQLQASYETLKNYGNMSSPTILFVLKHLIDNMESAKANETIFTAAFGPGITLETMHLQYV